MSRRLCFIPVSLEDRTTSQNRLISQCLEDEDEIDDEETAGRDGEAAQGLAGRGPVLRVVVRVQCDDAHSDEQRATDNAQQRLLKRQEKEFN